MNTYQIQVGEKNQTNTKTQTKNLIPGVLPSDPNVKKEKKKSYTTYKHKQSGSSKSILQLKKKIWWHIFKIDTLLD